MVGKTNVAGARLRSVIAVTYPEGSVCTCSNGTKTLKAKDTSGKALFNVPSAGTWTVSCTDGSKEKSVDVTITAAGQVESVNLSYALYLYNYGDKCEAVTGGWEQYRYNGYGEGSWAYNSDNIFVNGVDVTNSATVVSMVSFDPNLLSQFSQLKYTVSSPQGAENKLVIFATKPFYENIVASVDCNGVAGTYSISLDNISSGWPALFSYKGSQKVHAVWLEV